MHMVESDQIIWTFAIATAILFLFAIFFIIFSQIYTQRQQRFLQEKSAIESTLKAQYSEEILKSQIEIQNTILQQVSQDLHDNIGQTLSVAKIITNILEEMDHAPPVRQHLHQLSDILSKSIADLRGLTRSLDGDFVRDFGLDVSLSDELSRLNKTGRFEARLYLIGDQYSLGYDREIVLFRIAQEILNNAIKHSAASEIFAQVEYGADTFKMSIHDNGKGFIFNPESGILSSGAGLRNIQRRAALIGGSIFIDTAPGKGTRIKIVLPHSP